MSIINKQKRKLLILSHVNYGALNRMLESDSAIETIINISLIIENNAIVNLDAVTAFKAKLLANLDCVLCLNNDPAKPIYNLRNLNPDTDQYNIHSIIDNSLITTGRLSELISIISNLEASTQVV